MGSHHWYIELDNIYLYCLVSLLGLVRRHDLHDIDSALSGVYFHLPCFSPLFKGRDVILEFLVVVLAGYPLEKQTVIWKEFCV